MGEDKEGEAYKYDPDFKGPIKNRSCTDIICCILIAIFFVAFIAVGIWSYVQADPALLLNPVDSYGNVCGHGNMQDRPNLFFFDLLSCAREGLTSVGSLIVNGCPTPQICLEKCPDSNYVFLESLGSADQDPDIICLDNVDKSLSIKDLVLEEKCAAYYVKSTPVLGRCLPSALVDVINAGSDVITGKNGDLTDKFGNVINGTALEEAAGVARYIADFKRVATEIADDVQKTWWIVLIFLLGTMLVSIFWMLLLRFTASLITWFLIFAFAIVFGIGTSYCFYRYWQLEYDEIPEPEFRLTFDVDFYLGLSATWLILGIICALFLGIVLIMVLCLWERIRIAVSIIEHTSKALAHMMSALAWPFIPFLVQLAILAYAFASFAHIIVLATGRTDRRYQMTYYNISNDSSGVKESVFNVIENVPCDPDNSTVGRLCTFFKYGDSTEYSVYVLIFQVFTWIWLTCFVSAIGELVLAGSFASYYWAFNKPKDIPALPLLNSIGRTFRYHIGSAAFGSFIIALIKLIQILLEYLHRKFKESDNSLAAFAVKCLKCCCWCVERFVLFLNKNAYILVAVHGSNFCSSAWRAFKLIARNILRVFVVDKISDFLMFIGRVTVMASVAIPAGFFFSGKLGATSSYVRDLHLHYYVVPIIIVIVGSYIIAYEFFLVYEMGVDTIFLCFLEDLERNDGSPEKPYYMSKDLMKILGKKNVKPKPQENTTENL